MRGSELSYLVALPVMDTQSWVEELWKQMLQTWACSRSENFWLWVLARKRKSGPLRLATAMERWTG